MQVSSNSSPVSLNRSPAAKVEHVVADVLDTVDDFLYGIESKIRAVCDLKIDDSNDPDQSEERKSSDRALVLAEEGRFEDGVVLESSRR